ncbi:MAG: ABC transporter substrate-binding protein [Candidatus Krumholzibacteriia bacterium]
MSTAGAGGFRRIACLSEEPAEILYHLGEEDRIVGITEYTCRPPRARDEKPVVSQFVRADLGRIAELMPDLVIGFSDLQADIAAALLRRGLNVLVFNQRSVADILQVVRAVGALVDRAEDGRRWAVELQSGLDDVRGRAAALPRRPRVYFEEWPRPIITAIGWVAELVEIAGGEYVFPDLCGGRLAAERTVADPAEILARRPELMLASWCGARFRPEVVLRRPGFAASPLAEPGRLLEVPSEIILQPGPAALTDGLDALHAAIARVAAEPPPPGR